MILCSLAIYPISKRIWEKLERPCKVGAVKTKIILAAKLSIQEPMLPDNTEHIYNESFL